MSCRTCPQHALISSSQYAHRSMKMMDLQLVRIKSMQTDELTKDMSPSPARAAEVQEFSGFPFAAATELAARRWTHPPDPLRPSFELLPSRRRRISEGKKDRVELRWTHVWKEKKSRSSRPPLGRALGKLGPAVFWSLGWPSRLSRGHTGPLELRRRWRRERRKTLGVAHRRLLRKHHHRLADAFPSVVHSCHLSQAMSTCTQSDHTGSEQQLTACRFARRYAEQASRKSAARVLGTDSEIADSEASLAGGSAGVLVGANDPESSGEPSTDAAVAPGSLP